jgi:hypothetical protein
MHKSYFPRCKVPGAIVPPTPFSHLGCIGAVPNKCGSCDQLFEGGCRRGMTEFGMTDYLHVDHGECAVNGPTDPVFYSSQYITSKVTVPRKCTTCRWLENDKINGFYCAKDQEIWGDFHRGLDWGAWRPDRIYIELPQPKITTPALSDCAHQNDVVAFIKEHRRGSSLIFCVNEKI